MGHISFNPTAKSIFLQFYFEEHHFQQQILKTYTLYEKYDRQTEHRLSPC